MNDASHPDVHLICQAHIDPIWIWDWEEGFAEALATFQVAANLLDEDPDFVFNHNESLLYLAVREYRPELFERIRKHVAAGRWIITGGWFLQPDCNLPLGESFARQILIGREFFRREFGVEPKVAYNFDSFGHHGNMPQFLRLAGYETYVHFRPLPGQLDLPDFIYTWEGVDGSRIATLRPPCGWYCTHPGSLVPDKIEAMLRLAAERGFPVTCFWGAGNHGGGATRADLAVIASLKAEHPGLRHGSLEEYCREVVVPLSTRKPPQKGELQKCFTGCYTSAIGIKQRNRRGEGLALAAERYAALAWWFLGETYPADTLQSVWRDVLYNQFHDILPGSAIRLGVESSAEIMGRAFTNAREVMLKAQLALARSQSDKKPLTIRLFNPHPRARSIPAIVDMQLATHPAFLDGKYLALYDAHDQPVPRQLLAYRCHTAAWRNTFLFEAELPACGVAEYRIEIQDGGEAAVAVNTDAAAPEGFVPVDSPELHDASCRVADHSPWYETDHETISVRGSMIEATLSRKTGRLLSLKDARTQQDMLGDASGSLLVRADTNDAWGGGQNAYGEVVETFELPDANDLAAICGQYDPDADIPAAVRIIASGPLALVVEVVSAISHSDARTRYTFHRHHPWVDVDLRINWGERCRALQFEVNSALPGATYWTEIPHAAIERPRNGGEEPCGRWTMFQDDKQALALINDGPGGVDVAGTTLRQTLLRSATFSAGNARPKPGFLNEHMSLGEHCFRFKLVCGQADEVQQLLPLLSDDLTLPFSTLTNIPLDAADKPGAEQGTELLRLDTVDNVHLEAIKQSEDGRALIVRLAERGGNKADATLVLRNANPVPLQFSPFEMITLRFERDANGIRARRCNLLERVE